MKWEVGEEQKYWNREIFKLFIPIYFYLKINKFLSTFQMFYGT